MTQISRYSGMQAPQRINLRNQLFALTAIGLHTVGAVIGLLYFGFEMIAIAIFGAMWLAVLIPTIFLHIEYYAANRGMTITIDKLGIEFEKKGVKSVIKKSDIKEIFLFKSAGTLTPMESYHFARIVAKEEEIVVTNLIISDVEQGLKDLNFGNIKRFKRIFSSISMTK
jgi:hypothetical protein